MLTALITIVIAVLIAYLIYCIVGMFPLPPVVRQIVAVLFLIVLLLYILQLMGVNTGVSLR